MPQHSRRNDQRYRHRKELEAIRYGFNEVRQRYSPDKVYIIEKDGICTEACFDHESAKILANTIGGTYRLVKMWDRGELFYYPEIQGVLL